MRTLHPKISRFLRPKVPHPSIHFKIVISLLGLLALTIFRPSVLYYPTQPTKIGHYVVYDDQPIQPSLFKELALADSLLAYSHTPVKGPIPIYFCSHKLRCTLLLLTNKYLVGTFLPGRPGIAIPHTAAFHPSHPLSFALVHELAHLALYQHVGYWHFLRLPLWVQEGYAGHVALSAPSFEARSPSSSPAIPAGGLAPHRLERDDYYQARVAVTFLLTSKHVSLDSLTKNPPAWPHVLTEAKDLVSLSGRYSFEQKSFSPHDYTSSVVSTLFSSLERAKKNLALPRSSR